MEDIYKKLFSKNLKYYMKLTGINQTDITRDLNISKSTISTWCRGTRLPRMHHLQALADYLNVDKSMLIDKNLESIENVKGINYVLKNIENTLKSTYELILEGKPLNEQSFNIIMNCIEICVELAKNKE